MSVWGTLVVPFPLTAGVPLVGSTPCHANSPPGRREQCRLSKVCLGIQW